MPSVLITGCSSGFGLQSTVDLAKKGWTVYATMRDLAKREVLDQKLQESGVQAVISQLDVTDAASCQRALQEVLEQTGGTLDALVNNAGTATAGTFEETDDSEWARVFEANLFGTFRMTKLVLPIMRNQGSGRIVFISSNSAMSGNPALSLYCSSKWALEGWAESIAYEVEPFNIQLSLLQPGTYDTGIWKSTPQYINAEGPYKDFAAIIGDYVENEELPRARDPKEVSKAVVKALEAKKPQFRYAVGPDAKVNAALAKLPFHTQAWAIRKLTHLNKWRPAKPEPIIDVRSRAAATAESPSVTNSK